MQDVGTQILMDSGLATSLEALSDIFIYPPLLQIKMYHQFMGNY